MRRNSWLPYIAILAGVIAAAASVGEASPPTSPKEHLLAFSGDPNKPRRHFRVKDVADLSDQEREALYRDIQNQLQLGYAISGDPTAKHYQCWKRANTAPYRSATHGRRFVSNFVNAKAVAYLQYEKTGTLPVGAIIAKDSFGVAKDGTLTPGPLFVMEKMAKGFSYVSGDWRYAMIMPDGSLFGESNGGNAGRVEFCIGCHLAQEKQDHLYFVPKKYRIQ